MPSTKGSGPLIIYSLGQPSAILWPLLQDMARFLSLIAAPAGIQCPSSLIHHYPVTIPLSYM